MSLNFPICKLEAVVLSELFEASSCPWFPACSRCSLDDFGNLVLTDITITETFDSRPQSWTSVFGVGEGRRELVCNFKSTFMKASREVHTS
jgi:hypothetical protein